MNFRRFSSAWLLLLPLILYAAALNPYYLPGTYDDVVYYSGAVSLADEGTFQFRDKHISDWPPGVSALMAVPFYFFGESIWMAKILILLCAGAGLLVALRLFQKEQRPYPLQTLCLFALLPASFMMGTRIMSEWPYFLVSMLFLLALHNIRNAQRNLWPAVVAGLLLGMASLTKFTGVLLGAAVLAQMVDKLSASTPRLRWRALLPEFITAFIGGGLFLLWKAKIQWQIRSGTAAAYEYYDSGWLPGLLGWLNPLSVPARISDLFFHSDAALGFLGWEGWTARLAATLPGLLVLAGLMVRLCSKQRTPGDWYVVSLLLVFSAAGSNQQTRYLMPVAPFLIGYGIVACQSVASLARLQRWRAVWTGRAAVAAWMLLLTGSAFHLLFVGNLSGTHRGLCYAVSSSPENFYRGFWRDLYLAGQRIKQNSTPGDLVVIGDNDRYVTAFTGRDWVNPGQANQSAFLLALDGTEPPPEQLSAMNLRCWERFDSLLLYKRAGPVTAPDAPLVSANAKNGSVTETVP